jgi:hypothetical protein
MQYTIYFTIGTKKLKHTLEAYSREDAISRLRQKIEVLRVDEEREYDLPPEHDADVEYLKSIFGIK